MAIVYELLYGDSLSHPDDAGCTREFYGGISSNAISGGEADDDFFATDRGTNVTLDREIFDANNSFTLNGIANLNALSDDFELF